jgi:NADPH-dependent 2,4-dienoyl-CoA reductase/sulfur reductase-like enzyme
VHQIRTFADAVRLRTALVGAESVAVIGAGFIGSEIASAARERGLKVTIMEAAAAPMAHAVGAQPGAALAALHQARRWRRVRPDLGTGIPGLAAAGDVCNWADSRWGQVRLEHWSNAIDQGMHAAQTALAPSGSASFSSIPYFWSEWYGTKIQLVGRADGEETLTVGAVDEGRFIVLYRNGGELRGGLTVGRPGQTAGPDGRAAATAFSAGDVGRRAHVCCFPWRGSLSRFRESDGDTAL